VVVEQPGEGRTRELTALIGVEYLGRAVDFTFHYLYPPTVNSVAEAQVMRSVMEGVVGRDSVLPQQAAMTAEDFSFMLEAMPGAYAFIGSGDDGHRDVGHGAGPCTLHNPSYDFNDDLIPLGATVRVRLVEQFLMPVGEQPAAHPHELMARR